VQRGYNRPVTAEQQLQPYLAPRERLLWSGRPDRSVLFSPRDVFLVPFSLMWGGFAIFWEAAVIFGTEGTNVFFILWGIPFVCVGLYLIFGRFVAKQRMKSKTAYGLTDRRALVAIGDRSLSDSPVRDTATSIRRSRDGSHVSVTFGAQSGSFRAHAGNADLIPWWTAGVTAFLDVADPDGLLEALRRVQQPADQISTL
jgi:hypothetical protein